MQTHENRREIQRLLRQVEAEVRSGRRRVEVSVQPRETGVKIEVYLERWSRGTPGQHWRAR